MNAKRRCNPLPVHAYYQLRIAGYLILVDIWSVF